MKEWILIDTETTGITNPIYIVEIYAQKMVGLRPHGDPLHVFLNHNVTIPPEASAIHGYTTELISKIGINPWKAHKELENYIEKRPVCSHNLSYDWERCILPERRRLKLPFIGGRGFCTVQLFRRCLPAFETFKLEKLREIYQIENKSHSAKGDVLTVLEILDKYAFPKLGEVGINTFDEIKEFSKKNPIGLCRQTLKLEPLLNTKPTPDDILSVLAHSSNNKELKGNEIEIINTWVGENIQSLGLKNIPPRIERVLDTGIITQESKNEILELIQPLLPLDEDEDKPHSTYEQSVKKETEVNKDRIENQIENKTNNQAPTISLSSITPTVSQPEPKVSSSPNTPEHINATLRQLNYIKVLGVEPPKGLSKKEASKLIDKIKSEKYQSSKNVSSNPLNSNSFRSKGGTRRRKREIRRRNINSPTSFNEGPSIK
jgi:DNA polymerase III epsilon subunit-like protein